MRAPIEKEETLTKTKSAIKVNTVHNVDCLALLRGIRDKSIHAIITDPPYNIGYELCDWDRDALNWQALGKECKRILKDNGCLALFQGWSSVANTMKILDEDFYLKNWIIYDRIKGRGAKNNLISTREDILWYVVNEKRYTYNKRPSTTKKATGGSIGKRNGCAYRMLSNVWSDISPIVPWSKERKNHPTQKPLQLMERIVEIFTNEGDIVLDPFCGSGATLLASKNLRRGYIGTDTHEAYCNITKERLGLAGNFEDG